MTSRHTPTPRPRGATILEALIAMVVMAMGLLGIAALQAKLRLASDVSKQRSEAVRIAQEDLENFRAFGTLVADGGVANNFAYAGVTSAAATKTQLAATATSTNATYAITRDVVTTTSPNMKDLRVMVSWTNREGVEETVTLRSVIAGNDPRLAAAMAIAPSGSPIRDALGRDIQIPIPAKNLGDGTSVFKPLTNGTTAFVFNNDSGLITQKCTGIGTGTYTVNLTAGSKGTCTDVDARLLSGFIRTQRDNNPSAANPNDAPPGAVSIRLDLDQTDPPSGAVGTTPQLTSAYWPTAAQAVWSTGYTAPECAAEDSKTVSFTTPVSFSQINNGVTQVVNSTTVVVIVPAATPVTSAGIAPYVGLTTAQVVNPQDAGERYIAYTCVVYPRTFTAGNKAWTGRSLLVPSGWTIDTRSGAWKVCRYSADYNLNGWVWTTSGSNVVKIENAEHPYAYLQTTTGLQNQNFLIVEGDSNCPTDGGVEVDGTGGENYTDETTVTHQP